MIGSATLMVVGLLAVLAVGAARADTTADCGRFYLKYNTETKKAECVGGKRSQSKQQLGQPTIQTLTRQLQESVQKLKKALDGAEAILRTDQLEREQHNRVRELLQEAKQRVEEVKRRSQELAQAQKTRTKELESEERQRVQSQQQLADELERKQAALTQQLISEVRSRTQAATQRR